MSFGIQGLRPGATGWLLGCGILTGCGSGTPATVGSSPISPSTNGVYVPASVQQGIQSTGNFGDSITCGIGATSTAVDYASLLDAAIGAPATNLCRSGDQAADMTRLWVLPNALPALGAHQLYTVLIGTNDAHLCGAASACVANWQNALEASLVWLALPASDKTAAQAATSRMDAWANDLTTGLASTAAGASLTYTVNQKIAGRKLYVAYRVADGSLTNPGVASVEIDGQPTALLSAAVQTGQPIQTGNGTGDTVYVAELPLGAVGNQQVRVTMVSTGGGIFSLQWLGVSSGYYAGNTAAPRVVLGTILPTESDALTQTVTSYNSELVLLAGSLTTQGNADRNGSDVCRDRPGNGPFRPAASERRRIPEASESLCRCALK